MQAITLFNQNFAVAESLLQLHELFQGLRRADINDDLRLALCSFWRAPSHIAVQTAANDQVAVLARSGVPVPPSLTMDGGLDFLLREAIIVACTAVEAFFWDSLRENVLTIVRARKSGADESLKNLTIKLGDYLSIQQYEDPDLRLRQVILKNFERGTLYDFDSIDKIVQILTIKNFWDQIEKRVGLKAAQVKKVLAEVIQRRNQIAHRADRPDDGEEADPHGLRPIDYAWTHYRVQTIKTFVAASARLIEKAIGKLEQDIQVAQEQEVAQRVIKELSQQVETSEN